MQERKSSNQTSISIPDSQRKAVTNREASASRTSGGRDSSMHLKPVVEDSHHENIILGAMAHQMTGGKSKDMKQVKLPFDLNTLCTVDFSFHFETLKQAI